MEDYNKVIESLGVRYIKAKNLVLQQPFTVRNSYDVGNNLILLHKGHISFGDDEQTTVEEGQMLFIPGGRATRVAYGDGGGKAPALARPVYGRARVARTLVAWARAAARFGGAHFRRVAVNGQPGVEILDPDDRLISVMALEIDQGEIRAIRSIVNPDKLRHLGDVGVLADALRSAGPGRTTVPRD